MGERAKTRILILLAVSLLLLWSGNYDVVSAQSDHVSSQKSERGEAALHSNETMLEENGFNTQDIWNPIEPFVLPAPPEGMIWQDVTIDYMVRINLLTVGMVEKARGSGLPEATLGIHEYLLHGAMLDKIQERGINLEVLGGITRFILKRDPAEISGADDETPIDGNSSSGDVTTMSTGTCSVSSTGGPYSIPDVGWRWVGLSNSCAPSGSYVTNLEYRLRIDDTGDPSNFYCGDYEIYLSCTDTGGATPYYLVYDNLGGRTDGGYDDDTADDSDIYLNWRSTHHFDGLNPNQTWYVYIKDTMSGDVGELDYIYFDIHWQRDDLTIDLYDDGETWRSFSPQSGCPGESFEIHCDIRNGGTGDSGPFVVRFYASTNTYISHSDTYIGEVSMSSITAGDWANCDWSGVIPSLAEGSYWIGWIIDDDNQVNESDETNNKAYKEGYQLTRPTCGTPDLYDDGETWRWFSPQTGCTSDAFEIHCDIRNGGTADSGAFVVRFYASTNTYISHSDTYIGEVSMSNITAGDWANCDWSGVIPLLADGSYWIGWIIDDDNQVSESDETNNKAYKEGYQLVVLCGAPALSYYSHQIDDDTSGQSNGDGDGIPECGEAIEIWVALQNSGSLAATGVSATLSTSDPYVTITDNSVPFPDISAGGTAQATDDFDMTLANSVPDGHAASFTLNITSNEGLWIDSFSITIGCCQPPATPGSISYPSSDCDGSYTVSWSSVSGATSYRLERSSNGGSTWGHLYTGSNTSYPENIGNGSYRYRVRASNSCGNSGWRTGTHDCVVSSAPATPSSIGYPTSDCDGSYTVSWSSVSGATSYQLQRSNNGGSTWSPIYNGSNTSYAQNVGNGSYRYRVRASNSCGNSEWRTGTHDCVVSSAPATPSSISYPSSDCDGSYTVSWSSVSGATSYRLERSNNGGSTWSAPYTGASTSYLENVCPIPGAGSYMYRVRATNSCGSSGWRTGGTITVNCGPSVSILTSPDSASVPRGGTLGYYVTGYNNCDSPVTFQYWTHVILPDSSKYPPSGELIGPVLVTLPALGQQTFHVTHPIPIGAPVGTYTYRCYVGTYPFDIWDEYNFNFEVTP